MEVVKFESDYKSASTTINLTVTENVSDFNFKMSKYQGDSEVGFSGFLELMALQSAINNTLDYMIENHPDVVAKVARRMIANEVANSSKGSLLKEHLKDPEEFDFRKSYSIKVSDLEEADEIDVSHEIQLTMANFKEKKSFKEENLKIHAGKWQGECEKGEEGLYRLFITMKNINKVKLAVLEVFPDFNKRVESDLKEPKEELSSCFEK